jgi:hypothetical protein
MRKDQSSQGDSNIKVMYHRLLLRNTNCAGEALLMSRNRVCACKDCIPYGHHLINFIRVPHIRKKKRTRRSLVLYDSPITQALYRARTRLCGCSDCENYYSLKRVIRSIEYQRKLRNRSSYGKSAYAVRQG